MAKGAVVLGFSVMAIISLPLTSIVGIVAIIGAVKVLEGVYTDVAMYLGNSRETLEELQEVFEGFKKMYHLDEEGKPKRSFWGEALDVAGAGVRSLIPGTDLVNFTPTINRIADLLDALYLQTTKMNLSAWKLSGPLIKAEANTKELKKEILNTELSIIRKEFTDDSPIDDAQSLLDAMKVKALSMEAEIKEKEDQMNEIFEKAQRTFHYIESVRPLVEEVKEQVSDEAKLLKFFASQSGNVLQGAVGNLTVTFALTSLANIGTAGADLIACYDEIENASNDLKNLKLNKKG